MIVEVCVEGVASALVAGRAGADRVELCENLAVGGVTPGAGAIAVACGLSGAPVHVLIRPRGGDFVTDDAEYEAMRYDVAACRELGAAGVVLGILTHEGRIDRERTRRLVELASPLEVTFHRAFDATRDPLEALEDVVELGIGRILTSGGAARAVEAADRLAELVRVADGRLTILAGGGVRPDDLERLAGAGLTEIHAGSACAIDGRTDAARVGRLVEAARRTSGR